MPVTTLSQLFPALTFLRSAANSGSRPTVNARPVARESPRRTHAFNQSRRPAEPKRHTAVIVRLEANRNQFLYARESHHFAPIKHFNISGPKLLIWCKSEGPHSTTSKKSF